MSTVIHIAAEAEPTELHGVDETKEVFGAHLAVEARMTNGTSDENEANAKAAFGSFLHALPTGRFYLLAVRKTDESVVGYTELARRFAAPPSDGKILAWLESARAAFKELADNARELTPGDGRSDETFAFFNNSARGDASVHNARAIDLLRATAKWPAPIAQNAGLTVALESDVSRDPANHHAVVFVEDGLDIANLSFTVTISGELMMLAVADAGGSTLLEIHSSLVGDYAAPGPLFESDGRFDTLDNADILARLAGRIEELSPSLLTASALLDDIALDEGFIRGLAGLSEGEELKPEQELPDAVWHWLMQISVVSLFDVPLAALKLPEPAADNTAPATPRNTVLQRLSRRIVGYFEQADPDADLDEARLYKKLHEALGAKLDLLDTLGNGTDRENLWASLGMLPGIQRMNHIHDVLTKPPPSGTVEWSDWQADTAEFSAQLSDLSVLLESETGFEAWLLGLTDAAFLSGGEFNVDLTDTGIPFFDPDTSEAAEQTELLTSLYRQFRAEIEGTFNAAEAMRRDFGALTLAALSQHPDFRNPADIDGILTDSNWFARRLFGVTAPSQILDAQIDACIKPAVPVDPVTLQQMVDAVLAPLASQRLAEILGTTQALGRFRPDASPQPLSIPITDTIDATKLDEANAKISGLGFLIRAQKADGTADETQHASLVSLEDRDGSETQIEEKTVLPTLPVMTPGCAGMFVQYSGAPLATPNRPTPLQGGADLDPMQAAQARAEAAIRGYLVNDTEIKLPALAYGRQYGVSGFWVPGSGVLPKPVRSDDDALFEPGRADGVFRPGTLYPYLRRTAIGNMELKAPTAVPKDVHPLAMDDPRLVLESLDGGARHLALYRRADGTGGLEAEDDDITLHDVSFSNGLGTQHLLVTQLSADGNAEETSSVSLSGSVLTIKLNPASAPDAFWLRLSWKADAPTGGCLSFDDPAHDKQQDSAGRQSPVMLLAPNSDKWRHGHAYNVTLSAPAVSFADFECWARNETLWQETAGGDLASRNRLFKALRWAQALFEETGDDYAEKMNRLPDPAVRKLVLIAAASDQVQGQRDGARNVTAVHAIDPYNPARLTLPATFALPDLSDSGMTPEDIETALKNAIDDRVKALRLLVDDIQKHARLTVRVSIAAPGATELEFDADHNLSVPEGWIARLSAHPAVPSVRLKPVDEGGVFDPGMNELAQGHLDDATLFDGPKLQIEAMLANPEGLKVPPERLHSVSQGIERSYALEFEPEGADRIFGSAQLSVQQWRPTGRPIYHWIDPVPKDLAAKHPVVPIKPLGDEDGPPDHVGKVRAAALTAFEADAFFAVGSEDVDRKPVIRLLPAPERTRLDTLDWPERSAAYFRHRLELRNRYIGAMSDPADGVVYARRERRDDGNSTTQKDAWTTRTAILAEPLNAELTRPQVRAFFPVQRTLDSAAGVPIAPVACILAEPPFEQLGLADRIDADLKTINTYKIDADPPKLHVDGMRKELGPDPRLSYFNVADDASRAATLMAEGPVGLHFESGDVGSPAFANSQFMLHVTAPKHGMALPAELEESFAGVALSRYADPAWSCTGGADAAAPATELPAFHSSWIELDRSVNLLAPDGDVTVPVVEILKSDDSVVVSLRRSALFEDGGQGVAELCRIEGEDPQASALIRPIGDGRYQLSIHRRKWREPSGDGQHPGRIARPHLVASVIFKTAATLALSAPMKLRATRQSDTTFVEWVRTARDMSHVMQRGAPDTGEPDIRIPLEELTPVLPASGNGNLTFRDLRAQIRRIASPVATRRYPLHVQRHLALLMQKPSRQIGHEIDLFDQAVVADGWGQAALSATPGASVSVAELEVRAEILRVQNSADPDTGGASPGDTPPHAALDRYNAAHFDLVSTRPDSGDQIQQMRLHCRAANQPLDLHRLRFVLKGHGEADVISLDPEIAAGTTVWSVELFVHKDANSDAVMWSMRWPGDQETRPQQLSGLGAILKADSFDLSIVDDAHRDAERWLDVSLLHSVKARQSALSPHVDSIDFDWLFGGTGTTETLPAALAPKRLNHLPEAQARLIGVSDPMTIEFR